MSPRRRNEILVGSFIFLSLMLLLVLLFAMGSLDSFFEQSHVVAAEFDDVQGLQQGDPVSLLGFRVGKVASVELLPRREGMATRVRVTMKMPAQYIEYLRVDSIAHIDKNLTGNLRVNIHEGTGQPLPQDGTLCGETPADFSAVAARMEKVLIHAEEISSAVSTVVKQVESKTDLALTLSKLAAFPEELRSDLVPVRDRIQEVLSAIRELLNENRLDLRHTVASLKEATAQSKTLFDRLLQTPYDLEKTLSELTDVATEAKRLLSENRPNVTLTLEDLRQTALNASQLTAEVKRRPWRLLYRPDKEELKAMELYDAAWAFNLGSMELNRSLRQLVARLNASEETTPDDEHLDLVYQNVRESLRRQREAEELLWERLRASQN